MRLKIRDDWRRRAPVTIREAVEIACDPDGDGVAERAREKADRAVEMLGRLLTELQGSTLPDVAVLRVLGEHAFEVVE